MTTGYTNRSPIRADRQLLSRLLARNVKASEPTPWKSLGQLTDEYLRTPIGSEESERARIVLMLRMGLRVSR